MRRIALLLGLALLASCSGNGDDEAGEFADAVAVLAAENVITADPALAGQPIELPQAFENTAWEQVGGNPSHAPRHLAAGGEYERVWRSRVVSSKAKGAPVTAPPVTDGERLFFIDAVGVVTAIDTATGDTAWRQDLAPGDTGDKVPFYNMIGRTKLRDIGFGGGSAVVGGRLFVTSGFGFVAALDAATGELLWQTETNGPMRNPPSIADGMVYAVSISNELYALDQETGRERWTYQSFEEAARFLAASAPAVDGASVVVPFSSGEVVSLASQNGRVQWQAVIARTSRLNALSTLGDIAGSPVIDRGAVFAVSQSGQMVGIDARTGEVAWEQPVGGAHTPWVAGETIYVLSNQNTVAAVNRIDGAVRWNEELPLYRNPKKRKKRIVWAGPVLAGNLLYLTSTDGELIGLSPQTGETLASYKLGDGATQPPIVAGGAIYVLLENGQVEAFRPTAPAPVPALPEAPASDEPVELESDAQPSEEEAL
ncbi:outer membrane protein assembly factor BamB family protein [Parvularcula maris]|uniref:PQQ-binding-like beta-propeller repeat protein n=1 Tax=Parvularcula maris TaxID=2965077 RepID=A0A9X2LAH2_9PROT|nr:PQQ-binding-like beta-propeller repeat protein [Parvularcula maris]MCQ8186130.1 PQQ-binding-like beta-propeller repeat protein [Parvularcula maris]